MKRIARYAATVAIISIALGTAPAAAAGAESSSNGTFGHHVSECARTMGFDSMRNPGMHHGITGWDGMSCSASA